MLNNPILQSISDWFRRTFSDPEAVSLFMTLVIGLLFLELFGRLLMPVLVSVVIAYMLMSIVRQLKRWRCPHLLAVIITYLIFISLVVYLVFGLLPMLWKQLATLAKQLPHAFSHSQAWFLDLQQRYPRLFGQAQLHQVVVFIQDQSTRAGQFVVRYSLATIPSVIQLVLYLVLVPLLVFFFLKDSQPILKWFSQYMPSNRRLVNHVWNEVNEKIGRYVRGRVIEVIIVGFVSILAFALLNLQYAVLLGALVGLSVIIPYIGAALVTIPVVIIALMEWGLAAHFWYVVVAYALIITLDANLLVPYLFAGAMNLHPVVILFAVIVFGAIWGFWGVFFAIPLATLIHAVLKAWPRGGQVNSSNQN